MTTQKYVLILLPIYCKCTFSIANSIFKRRLFSGNARSATYQFMETIYDTILFGLLIYRTVQVVRVSNSKNLITVLARHGVIYFGSVLLGLLIWIMWETNGVLY